MPNELITINSYIDVLFNSSAQANKTNK